MRRGHTHATSRLPYMHDHACILLVSGLGWLSQWTSWDDMRLDYSHPLVQTNKQANKCICGHRHMQYIILCKPRSITPNLPKERAAVMLPCVPCFTNFCRPLAMRFAVGRSTIDVNSSRMSTDAVSMARTRAMCARASSPHSKEARLGICVGMVETKHIKT